MSKITRNLLITMLLLAFMPAVHAFESTLLIEGGVGIPLDDIEGSNEMKGAWAVAWDGWMIKDWLGIGASPWFANVQVQGDDPMESYFSSIEGINLYLKLRPTKVGALNFSEKAVIRRISPFVALGGGWSTHGSKDEAGVADNPSIEPGFMRGHFTLPHAAAGISFLTGWNTTLDLGVKYDLFTKDNIDLTETGSMNDALLTPYIGLGLHFGTPKAVPILGYIGALTGFSTFKGTPSAPQAYRLKASDLRGNVEIVAPDGFVLSIDRGKVWAKSVIVPADFAGDIWVRLTGDEVGTYTGSIGHKSEGAADLSRPVSGVVTLPPVPKLELGSGVLGGFSTELGKPSAPQSYKLNASNLTGDINIKAPAGYEFSLDGGKTWATSMIVPASFDKDIWVRLTGAQAGSFGGVISHSSPGATTFNLPVSGMVIAPSAPSILLGSAGLGGFSTELGKPSEPQSYKLKTGNLTGDINIKAPAGYEFSVDGGKTWATSTTLPANFDKDIWVRMTGAKAGNFGGSISHDSPGAVTFNLPVSGVVLQPEAPSIALGSGGLSGFSTELGKPSEPQSYKLKTGNLTGDINIKAPAGYEISVDGGTTWVTSIIVPSSFNKDIWVRLSGAKAGNFGGSINHDSPGAMTFNLPVSGVVLQPEAPSIVLTTGSLAPFSTEQGKPSEPQSYKIKTANLTGDVNIKAPAGYEISVDGGKTWVTSIIVPSSFNKDIWVRLTGAQAGNYSGSINHASPGTTTFNLPVIGTVTAPVVKTDPELEKLEQDLLNHMVHFDTNYYTIRAGDRPFLDRVAESLKKLPEAMIEIQGHTDNTGTDKINEPLSHNRAKAVMDYLVARGVNAEQLDIKGYSSTKPIATNNTKAGRQENRRAQMILIK